MKSGRLVLFLGSFIFLFCGSAVHAQLGPEKGDREIEIWTSGGYGIKGIAQHTGAWSFGGRYGWVLTPPSGPSFLRGRLEYAADVAPGFVLFQRTGTAYGVAINPLNLKWNFAARGRVVPYVEVGGGMLFTNRQTPPGTSRSNFMTGAALGMNIIGGRFHYSVDLRYSHISDSGLTPINPGINLLQMRIGIGLYRGRHDEN